jgi:hypothetical protein
MRGNLIVLCVLMALLECSHEPPPDLLKGSIRIPSDRIHSAVEKRTSYSLKELVSMLKGRVGKNGTLLKISDIGILSTTRYTISGKDTLCKNLFIDLVYDDHQYRMELRFNSQSIYDSDVPDYDMVLIDKDHSIVNVKEWFDTLYAKNEKELKTFDELKGKKLYYNENHDLFDAYNAFLKRTNVKNLRVFKIADTYYFTGKNDTTAFLSNITYDSASAKYSLDYFIPSQNQGTHAWFFSTFLFSEQELP